MIKWITFFILMIPCLTGAQTTQKIILNVPLVAQGKKLCGPATIEMVFKYWGIGEYSQYDIAESILDQYADAPVFKASGVLNNYPRKWEHYPGVKVTYLQGFLARFGKTLSLNLNSNPQLEGDFDKKRIQLFNHVKAYIANGIPVIVFQYWELPRSQSHYRVVVGYDEAKRLVYLNDAKGAKRIVQTYEEFLNLWNVEHPRLRYYAVAFNTERKKINVKL
ncbi:C39 family peptidase [Pseudoalteromonas sp. SMS1]|uniref:C39 family peptidase n=1 Tax=Pseudoalteromonas sp. SMS1 TaxID=2908894 RepID=UPI001F1924C7|nr:C39 family peptidase [Pseudoalteromonas sp. SMS1]MCF2859802.1 C39 family peptidase [Pseudoalteromonas sp. SMS1]